MDNLKSFVLHKNFGISPTDKPKVGKLVEIVNRKEVVLEEDKPFALLTVLKKNYINKGYKAKNLKIKY